jgi:hypothetical protein
MTDPFGTILTTINNLGKVANDIASASNEAKRNAQLIEFQRAIIQLQSSIASVQAQNASLLREKNDFEEQIVRAKKWDNEKQRYALVDILEGAGVAFALKESMSQREPAHWLCTNCFHAGTKSVLNTIEGARGFSMLACPVCKAKLQSHNRGPLRAEYAPA